MSIGKLDHLQIWCRQSRDWAAWRGILGKNKFFPGRFLVQPSAANGRERICLSPKYHAMHPHLGNVKSNIQYNFFRKFYN